jgi:hypothetical protein
MTRERIKNFRQQWHREMADKEKSSPLEAAVWQNRWAEKERLEQIET